MENSKNTLQWNARSIKTLDLDRFHNEKKEIMSKPSFLNGNAIDFSLLRAVVKDGVSSLLQEVNSSIFFFLIIRLKDQNVLFLICHLVVVSTLFLKVLQFLKYRFDIEMNNIIGKQCYHFYQTFRRKDSNTSRINSIYL